MRNSIQPLLLAALTLLAAATPPSYSQSAPQSRRVSYLSYEDAHPILEALSDVLPGELKALDSAGPASVWSKWAGRRDAEIRARLVQGDEDSLVNLLLFGTSFTRRPRITLKSLAQARLSAGSPEAAAFVEATKGRAADL